MWGTKYVELREPVLPYDNDEVLEKDIYWRLRGEGEFHYQGSIVGNGDSYLASVGYPLNTDGIKVIYEIIKILEKETGNRYKISEMKTVHEVLLVLDD